MPLLINPLLMLCYGTDVGYHSIRYSLYLHTLNGLRKAGNSSFYLVLLGFLMPTLFQASKARAKVSSIPGKSSFCAPNPLVHTYTIASIIGAASYSWSITTPGNSTNNSSNAQIINPVDLSALALKAFASSYSPNLLPLQNQLRCASIF